MQFKNNKALYTVFYFTGYIYAVINGLFMKFQFPKRRNSRDPQNKNNTIINTRTHSNTPACKHTKAFDQSDCPPSIIRCDGNQRIVTAAFKYSPETVKISKHVDNLIGDIIICNYRLLNSSC